MEELRECTACSCPPPPSCEFCQYGINGNLCRPNTTIWCQGCSTAPQGACINNNCTRCIFAGPNNTKLCVPVTLTQDLGQFVGVQGASSDKLITVNIISAAVKSWIDAGSALADAGGADTFVLQNLLGAPIVPVPSAFSQVNFDAALLMASNIVWSASLLNETIAESESSLAALLSQGLRGQWRSATNNEFKGTNGFVLPLTTQGAVRDLTTLPVLPMIEYSGICKTNMCTAQPPTVVVPVDVIPIRN